MKTGLLCLLASVVLCLAGTSTNDPTTVFRTDGVLIITDGSSFYLFRTNGTFVSTPAGLSGRTFEGTCTWSSDENKLSFSVKAREGWWNGPGSGDDYRIALDVWSGKKKPPEGLYPPHVVRTNEVYDCYFLIREMVVLPKTTK
jgi:hypothetical protein